MDDGASSGKAKFSNTDERIFALLALVEDQQTAVRAGLQGLAHERAALATERVALVQQAEKMGLLSDKIASAILQAIPKLADSAGQAAGVCVTRALQGTVATAIHAAGVAAQPTLDGFAQAVKSAAAVQHELKNAVEDFKRQWKWAVVFAVLGMLLAAVLVTAGSVWLQTKEVAQLMAQKNKLSAEVNALQEQADQARRNNGRKAPK